MPAIAGFIAFGSSLSPRDACAAMLAPLARFGPDGTSIECLDDASFGCQFQRGLPEDDFDRQPFLGAGGNILLSADARIDNRSEIASSLGLSSALNGMSDTELLLRGWERWGLALIDRLLGDVALAVWDRREDRLTLARTPLSTRPLFFHQSGNSLAFGTLPSAILALPSVAREPNIDQMAVRAAGGIYLPGNASLFRGIDPVPQGHALLLGKRQKQSVALWSLGAERLDVSVAQAGEALRAELDRAVAARLRRRSGSIACELSSGRDSSAVATSAARIESHSGRPVIALTAAPRADFPDDAGPFWLSDESSIAGKTARRAGLAHIICRPHETDFISLLDEVSGAHFQPFGNPANLSWSAQTSREAAAHGAAILLTGAAGNYALSAGGAGFLGDYRRERGWVAWGRLMRDLHHQSDGSWPNLLNLSFGDWLPRPIHGAMRRLMGRGGTVELSLPLFRSPFREKAELVRRDRLGDSRPATSRRQRWVEMLMAIEPGDKYSLATWGIDARDPTADRRLVELCHSLPVEAFIGVKEPRPAYAVAFAERLPPEVVDGKRAGFQSADWFEVIRPEEVRAAFRRYFRHPLVDELIDRSVVESRMDAWPRQTGYPDADYDLYCNQLLGALALASFINANFPH